MAGEQPARLVIHSSDNDWMIGDGINDPNGPDGSIATHLGHALSWNSSLRNLSTSLRHQALAPVCSDGALSMVEGGLLIQTLLGSSGAVGRPLWNRSGCAM